MNVTGKFCRWRRAISISVLTAFVLGIVFLAVFDMTLKWTNSENFCISCHAMKDNVYREYQNTIHYANRSGVRAVCADCHVPKEFLPKMVRKVQAASEVWHAVLGSIGTPEKFEAKRPLLAQREWRRMKASDSRECRNCHDATSFDYSGQGYRAVAQHMEGLSNGQTCIDCHKGIAHKLPPIDQGIGIVGPDGITLDVFHPDAKKKPEAQED
ncbi:MAG: NapC/NirT family cytochrome c [Azoarcus sp.]|jgi:cytochrome c-type protein NapC|nr:NapC/NirT family cytochrome c [Azoarcus sp.]